MRQHVYFVRRYIIVAAQQSYSRLRVEHGGVGGIGSAVAMDAADRADAKAFWDHVQRQTKQRFASWPMFSAYFLVRATECSQFFSLAAP